MKFPRILGRSVMTILLVLMLPLALSGCSTLKGWWDDIRSDDTIRFVVQSSLETMIKTNPEYQDRDWET